MTIFRNTNKHADYGQMQDGILHRASNFWGPNSSKNIE